MSAPVTIVEFSDLQCPHCKKLHATLRRWREKYSTQVAVRFRGLMALCTGRYGLLERRNVTAVVGCAASPAAAAPPSPRVTLVCT
ncbi:MAG: thioredoxin domain-containing protein [Gemmatimonadetes bacterium]|nr:thioredoxin domain-containing protein [Gemmatimonadota bacterium]